jgi:hypothetical protein
MDDPVRIDERRAEVPEDAANEALAARDPAGKSDNKHTIDAPVIFLISFRENASSRSS